MTETFAVVEPSIIKDLVGTPKLCSSNWGSNGLHVIETVWAPPLHVYCIGIAMSSIPSLHNPSVWILEPTADDKVNPETG